LISTHCAKAGVLGRLAARSLGIPSLFTAHGWAFSDGVPPRRRSLYRWMERSVAPLARRVIVVCEADRRTALRDRVVSIDQLRTVHNGMPDIDPAERARPGSTPVRLLTIARLAEQKDYRTLLHALARLRDLDWHLEQIGDGPQRSAIRAMADELKLSQRITWSGLSPDPIPSLARAQVYALISNWEGFPRSILEAMRAGLPVVASDVGGVRESVEDGATGFVVPRGDVDRLADRMRRLIESSALRSRFGSAGRARYERHFTFERMLADTWSVYLESIGAASGRRLREISPAGGERPCETQPRAL
jgi:glycosyltransferase involved in cell wall biosynthesis